MEFDAIKNSWKQENLQIAANVQLNKSALMEKINKETSWMKKKNLLVLLFRIPFPTMTVIPSQQNRGSVLRLFTIMASPLPTCETLSLRPNLRRMRSRSFRYWASSTEKPVINREIST